MLWRVDSFGGDHQGLLHSFSFEMAAFCIAQGVHRSFGYQSSGWMLVWLWVLWLHIVINCLGLILWAWTQLFSFRKSKRGSDYHNSNLFVLPPKRLLFRDKAFRQQFLAENKLGTLGWCHAFCLCQRMYKKCSWPDFSILLPEKTGRDYNWNQGQHTDPKRNDRQDSRSYVSREDSNDMKTNMSCS